MTGNKYIRGNPTKSRAEPYTDVAQIKADNGTRRYVQHYLTVFVDVLLGHFDAFGAGKHDKVRRKRIVHYPLIQSANEIWAAGTHGRFGHRFFHLMCAIYDLRRDFSQSVRLAKKASR